MVFRRALLFLSSLLLVLYALVLLNGQGDGRLLLSDYWVPRRSQLPGLAPPSTTRHLKLNDSVLEQLAKVDALAEQMEKESAEQPNTNLKDPAVTPELKGKETKNEKEADANDVEVKAPEQRRVAPVQMLEFGEEGYVQLERFNEHLRNILASGEEVRILHFGDSQID